ncbi:MAG: hypothetical protein R2878_04960 [Thermoleophilia bacterium]
MLIAALMVVPVLIVEEGEFSSTVTECRQWAARRRHRPAGNRRAGPLCRSGASATITRRPSLKTTSGLIADVRRRPEAPSARRRHLVLQTISDSAQQAGELDQLVRIEACADVTLDPAQVNPAGGPERLPAGVGEGDQAAPPVVTAGPALDETVVFEPVDQSRGAAAAEVSSLGQFGRPHRAALGLREHQQELVPLQRSPTSACISAASTSPTSVNATRIDRQASDAGVVRPRTMR